MEIWLKVTIERQIYKIFLFCEFKGRWDWYVKYIRANTIYEWKWNDELSEQINSEQALEPEKSYCEIWEQKRPECLTDLQSIGAMLWLILWVKLVWPQ